MRPSESTRRRSERLRRRTTDGSAWDAASLDLRTRGCRRAVLLQLRRERGIRKTVSGRRLARQRPREPWRNTRRRIARPSLLHRDVVPTAAFVASRGAAPSLAGILAGRAAVPEERAQVTLPV